MKRRSSRSRLSQPRQHQPLMVLAAEEDGNDANHSLPVVDLEIKHGAALGNLANIRSEGRLPRARSYVQFDMLLSSSARQ